jgi:hypothetical protein
MTKVLQSWCPLEATQYEGYCKDLHVNIRERQHAHCQHAPECAQLKYVLDSYALENRVPEAVSTS